MTSEKKGPLVLSLNAGTLGGKSHHQVAVSILGAGRREAFQDGDRTGRVILPEDPALQNPKLYSMLGYKAEHDASSTCAVKTARIDSSSPIARSVPLFRGNLPFPKEISSSLCGTTGYSGHHFIAAVPWGQDLNIPGKLLQVQIKNAWLSALTHYKAAALFCYPGILSILLEVCDDIFVLFLPTAVACNKYFMTILHVIVQYIGSVVSAG